MHVLKFGGSSVGTPERIQGVAQIIQDAHAGYGRVLVVVSAFGGVTDQLLAMARAAKQGSLYQSFLDALSERHLAAVRKLCVGASLRSEVLAAVERTLSELAALCQGVALTRELTARTQDAIMSVGERLSAAIISHHLQERGLPAAYLDARPLVLTDAQFGKAHVDLDATTDRIRAYVQTRPALHVATGFIGATVEGETTTLGRGGSDYTAAIFGAALAAEEIEIWTDVDGVLTADPRRVSAALPIAHLTYEEAMELAHFGAKVVYLPTMQPALLAQIPVRIKNTFHPEHAGTVISAEPRPCPYPIKGLTSTGNVTLLRIQGGGAIEVAGIAHRLFGALARQQISVMLITQASSEHAICVAVAPEAARPAKAAIDAEFALEILARQMEPVIVEPEHAILSAVGEPMRHKPGIAAQVFGAVARADVSIVAIAQGSSERTISFVVERADEIRALQALHRALFEGHTQRAHLFLVGPGLIGSTLLNIIAQQADALAASHGLELALVGLANSRWQLFDAAGIATASWRERLESEGAPASLEEFIAQIEALHLPNSVLVDCTASEQVPDVYARLLHAGVAIVTSNKKGNSGGGERYHSLNSYAEHSYFYETTVGAALPIIGTVRGLRATGDRIVRIEGVFSGTLSYLFNTYDGSTPFSAVVRRAREQGYTEPDVRVDLSGEDVARKLLILAREAGYTLELGDIPVAPFLPTRCMEAPSTETFSVELQRADAALAALYTHAQGEGKLLRYLARLDEGRARVGLELVAADHASATLRGTENVFSFTTSRYRALPLVVRGPGAGAELTAAGVYGDVLRAVTRPQRPVPHVTSREAEVYVPSVVSTR